MAKLTLLDVANLQNESSVVTKLTQNNNATEAAMENTLSRDGTSPNQMLSNLDMNNYKIINLPDALTAQEPATYSQLTSGLSAASGNLVNAAYVTTVSNPTLLSERVLTAGNNISITDTGANNQVIVAVSDNELTALATTTAAADTVPYYNGATTATTTPLTSYARTLIDDVDAATARSTLGSVIGTNVQAWDADLDAVAALASTGLLSRTGAGTVSTRAVTQPAAGITVTNGDGVAGNPTLALSNDLAAYEGLSSNGLVARTATDTATTRTITQPAAGITVTNGDGVSGNPTLALVNDLGAVEGLSTTGIVRRTGTDTWTASNAVTNAELQNNSITIGSVATALGGTLSAATGRGSTALNIDQQTGHGDSDYTILATDRHVFTNATFTATRTWTLPAANAVNPGQRILIGDLQGTVTSTNLLTIARAGSDTINGTTSLSLSSASTSLEVVSDGTSKWYAVQSGSGAGGSGISNPLNQYEFVATASQTSFSGADQNSKTLTYTVGNIEVYNNGLRLNKSDYTATTGTTVVLGLAANVGDLLTIVDCGSGGASSFSTFEYTSTAAQTTFSGADINAKTLAYTVNFVLVYVNGELLNIADYTATSGTSVVFAVGRLLNDQVKIISMNQSAVALLPSNNLSDVLSASTSRTNINAAPYEALAFNNLIINGAMEVDQEHLGAATTVSSGYVVDNWLISKTGTMVCTAQQVADAPGGFTNSLKVTVGTAQSSLGVSDGVFIYQAIEGFRTSKLQFGTANASTVTLTFATKIHRTGAYSGVIKNSAATRSYPFSFTQNVADTWEYKTVTIPGDITGTWIGNTNGIGLYVMFCMAGGTSVVGPATTWAATSYNGVTGTTNGVAATSDIFQITSVSLLPGSTPVNTATAPLLMRPYNIEYELCKRYYQRYGPLLFLNSGTVRTGGTGAYWGHIPTVEMRAATPTAGFGSGQIIVGDTITNITGLTASSIPGGLNVAPSWSGSIGAITNAALLYTGPSGTGITFDARL